MTRQIAPSTRRPGRDVVVVGIGLVVLGISSYLYLAFAAHALSTGAFGRISVVWAAVFTVGPGLFFPLEQEVGRRLAARRERSEVVGTLRFAGEWAALLVAGLAVLGAALYPLMRAPVFDNDAALAATTACAVAVLAPVHATRGVLAGFGRFGRYGAQLAIDGGLRAVGAAALAAGSDRVPSHYAAILAAAPLVAVGLTVPWRRARTVLAGRSTAPRPASPVAPGGKASLSWLLLGSLASQSLINVGTIVVKALGSRDAQAGTFLTAIVLTRLPLFLFSALQATLLPRVAGLWATGDRAGVRRLEQRVVGTLLGLGAVFTILVVAVGPQVEAAVFGGSYRLARAPMFVLALSCVAFMIAIALAQTVVAIGMSRGAALAWTSGALAFAVATSFGTGLETRVGVAMLIGAGCAAAILAALLRHALRERYEFSD